MPSSHLSSATSEAGPSPSPTGPTFIASVLEDATVDHGSNSDEAKIKPISFEDRCNTFAVPKAFHVFHVCPRGTPDEKIGIFLQQFAPEDILSKWDAGVGDGLVDLSIVWVAVILRRDDVLKAILEYFPSVKEKLLSTPSSSKANTNHIEILCWTILAPEGNRMKRKLLLSSSTESQVSKKKKVPTQEQQDDGESKCTHPRIFCKNGWSLCDYNDDGEICTVCKEQVCTDCAPCWEMCDRSCPHFRSFTSY